MPWPGSHPGGSGAHRRRSLGGAVALLVAAAVVVIAPWTIRNAVELHAFVPISTETGITLVGTYNREAAEYAPVPYKWIFYIRLPEDQALFHNAGRYTEVALSNRLVSQTLSYIGAHPLAPLDVSWHNLQRMLELEGTAAWHDSALAIGLSVSTAQTGVIAFWILGCLALLGAFTRAARRGPRWLWAVPVLMALSVLFVNVETPRFREPVEPFLVLLAACALARRRRVTRSSWHPLAGRAGRASNGCRRCFGQPHVHARARWRLGCRRAWLPTPDRRLLLGGAPVGRGRQPPRVAPDSQGVKVVQRLP